MYSNKLVASLKANGKILREFKDTIYIPFGSEYSILLKNLNSTRAVVNVFIDGDDIVPMGLVLNPGQECDLERAIKNGNLNEGNKFKFIERSESVEAHRGIKIEDGLVRIEFQFEMPVIYATNSWTAIGGSNNRIYPQNGILRNTSADWIYPSGTVTCSTSVDTMDRGTNDVGITVPGSKSTQSFQSVTVGALDPTKHTIVLKILGETSENQLIRKPITTKHKPKCITCGKQNKATAKFCTECGTALEIFA